MRSFGLCCFGIKLMSGSRVSGLGCLLLLHGCERLARTLFGYCRVVWRATHGRQTGDLVAIIECETTSYLNSSHFTVGGARGAGGCSASSTSSKTSGACLWRPDLCALLPEGSGLRV